MISAALSRKNGLRRMSRSAGFLSGGQAALAEGIGGRPSTSRSTLLTRMTLPPCAARMALIVAALAGTCAALQRSVEMRLRELLDAEAEREVRGRKSCDSIFPDRGLAAAGGTRDEDDLNFLERIKNILDKSGPLKEALADGGTYRAEHELGVLLERAQDLLLGRADRGMAVEKCRGQMLADHVL